MKTVTALVHVVVAGDLYRPGDLIAVDKFRRDDILQKMTDRGLVAGEGQYDAGELTDRRSDEDPET